VRWQLHCTLDVHLYVVDLLQLVQVQQQWREAICEPDILRLWLQAEDQGA
jgi:hypothetical protein